MIIVLLASMPFVMSDIERFEGLFHNDSRLIEHQRSGTTGWQVCDLPAVRAQRKGGDSIDGSNQYSLGWIFQEEPIGAVGFTANPLDGPLPRW